LDSSASTQAVVSPQSASISPATADEGGAQTVAPVGLKSAQAAGFIEDSNSAQPRVPTSSAQATPATMTGRGQAPSAGTVQPATTAAGETQATMTITEASVPGQAMPAVPSTIATGRDKTAVSGNKPAVVTPSLGFAGTAIAAAIDDTLAPPTAVAASPDGHDAVQSASAVPTASVGGQSAVPGASVGPGRLTGAVGQIVRDVAARSQMPASAATPTATADSAASPARPTQQASLVAPSGGPTLADLVGNDTPTGKDKAVTGSVDAPQSTAGAGLTGAVSQTSPQSPEMADAQVMTSSVQERIDVANQVAGHITTMQARAALTNQPQQATVQIQPPQWGDMKITVTVQSTASAVNGMRGVEAVLTARSDAVREAILSHDQDLRSTLASSGLKLDKLSVVVGSQSSSGMDSGQRDSGSSRDQQTYQGQPQSQFTPQGGGSGNGTGSWSNAFGGGSAPPTTYGQNTSTATAQGAPIMEDSPVPTGHVDYRV
jgi:hypothetical protein